MKDKLYRYALRFVKDGESAEDVVQDVMYKLWQKRQEVDTIENLEAWMMVLTRNRALDILRKVKDNQVNIDEAYSVSDQAPIPDKIMETADLMTQLNACLDQLPEKQRTVFHLREIEQMTYEEICTMTGFNLDDVKVSLFRSRKHIQRMLSKINTFGLYQA
ncbi:MAG: sigma-70 family RNA polymerase sigma factor [Saprospiraceae bacterium]|uniref:Sigma-70 family RNA polymerase sigma factor n=1 Tax=Candidatus Opimibacter skivensis TaxID=2982028 RepID=A0A9D7ST00_9BACT|nr:sigma-70 family RNA polymerase sigma factor [Candidatus Opimibacter skivensis]